MPDKRKQKCSQQFLHLGWSYSLQVLTQEKKVRLRLFHRNVLLRKAASVPQLEQVLQKWSQRKTLTALQKRVERYLLCFNQERFSQGNRKCLLEKSCGEWLRRVPPDPVFDYIMVYELCKTIYPHLGPEFQELLAALLPDHEKYKKAFQLYVSALSS